jgi:UDP-glucose 4-epimerase
LRYFNAAGADSDGEVGEDHDPETHLIPLVLDAAAGSRPDITIFGGDYATPDGTCVRDYVHVSDIAEAHVIALNKLDSGGLRAAYNLGTGDGISVAQVIAAAAKVTGRKIPVSLGARRAGDPDTLLADAARARDELEWRPRVSTIDKMIETAWMWRMRNRNR